MKKLLSTSAICLVCFFIACKDSSTTTTASSPGDSTSQAEKNRANSNAVYKGIETGDLSAMDEFVADDVVDHTGHPGEIKGRDSVKKMLADIHNHFSNLKIDLVAEATGGDYHFALTKMSGTTREAWMGMPANTSVERTTVDVVKFVDGKVKEHWGFVDPKDMMKNQKMDRTKKNSRGGY